MKNLTSLAFIFFLCGCTASRKYEERISALEVRVSQLEDPDYFDESRIIILDDMTTYPVLDVVEYEYPLLDDTLHWSRGQFAGGPIGKRGPGIPDSLIIDEYPPEMYIIKP